MGQKEMLLSCHDLSFAYEGKYVLTEVSFQVESGDYLCILGENGAGKSTLIKGLLGLKKPEGGRLWRSERIQPDQIGYLPQQTEAQKDFPASVEEVVLSGCLNRLGRRPFFGREQKELARQNMDRLGLLPMRKHCYRTLSGGQQQRVLLARALCAAKQVLLLDEPMTGLDPFMRAKLYRQLRQLRSDRGMTIIMVSHDLEGAMAQAEHILCLRGRQLFFGSPQEYRKDPSYPGTEGESE